MKSIEIKQLDIELSGSCNYTCTMCPQPQREEDFLGFLPLKTFKKAVDDAMQYGLEVVSLHGGGEPLLQRNIAAYIKYVKEKGVKCISFTNGSALTEKKYLEISNAKLDLLRVSAIGYDEFSYRWMMESSRYESVRSNVKRAVEIGGTEVQLYHLILDTTTPKEEQQIERYKENWIDYTGAEAEIWRQHNWAGTLDSVRPRVDGRRTCGRPFAPVLQVRAGGQMGKTGAVVACCMVLGKDSEATLGHLENQTISEVWNGELFKELRKAHTEERFDDISYCKDCDQLYDYPDALVWTNMVGRKYGQSKMIDIDFREYK